MQVNRADDLKVAAFEKCHQLSMNFAHYSMSKYHVYSSVKADTIIFMPMSNKENSKRNLLEYPHIGAKFYE